VPQGLFSTQANCSITITTVRSAAAILTMLGSDRFTFETPNVIDPGDLPPSQPRRDCEEKKADSMDEVCPPIKNGDDDDYQEARESRARLLHDLDDLDLTPTGKSGGGVPYDPYSDDDEEESGEGSNRRRRHHQQHHSLPTVEEARLYATSLLNADRISGASAVTKSPGKSPLPRSIQLEAPSARLRLLRRKRCGSVSCSSWRRVLVGVVIFAILLLVAILVPTSHKHKQQEIAATATKDNTSSNLSSRMQGMVQFLSTNGITSYQDLTTSGTPQNQAVNWLANLDAVQVNVPTQLITDQRFLQRYALVTFYYATGGGNNSWKESLQFLSDQDECGWYERKVVLDFVQEHTAFGVACDATLSIRSLFIPKNGLQGSLPSELRLLTTLDFLSLTSNRISGSLPDGLKALIRLAFLDVRDNSLSGTVPQWLGDLSQLEVLGLSSNGFAGSIPGSFGSLGKLKTLALDDNAFTGNIGFVNHLLQLQYLFASRNLFTGQVNDSFMSSLNQLRQVDLSFNNLRGDSIPLHLLQHRTMNTLDLADNAMVGSIPELTAENPMLTFLSLRRMGLTGTFPSSISNLRQLTHLDVYGNKFTGSIPNSLGNLIHLTYLFLGENPFTATQEFPPLFSQFSKLRELSLASANLAGTIPSWLSYLGQLRLLDLSGNSLVSTIPSNVWNLANLTYFLINDNSGLTGTIPSNIASPEKFDILALYHTGLTGDVNSFCQANPNMDLVAVDCSVTCSKQCCPECCDSSQADCFTGKVSAYLTWYENAWEFNYTQASYSFDPAILSVSGVVQIISEQESP